MGGLRFGVHPLFIVFGIYYAAVGRILEFVIYTSCAVIHEIGHSLAAASKGYRLNRIVLMPFGAVVAGNIEGLKFKDEISIALAGPFVNFAVGVAFVAAWWVYPESYAFTELAATACFSIAFVNLLPCFPLDGGRILSAALSIKFGAKVAKRVCRGAGVTFSVVLFCMFLYGFATSVNYSLLFFALFVLFGALGKNRGDDYVKLYSCVNSEKLKRGMPFNKIAVDESVPLKKLTSLLDCNCVNEVVVFSGDKPVGHLSQNRIEQIMGDGDIYSSIGKYLS